MLVFAFGYFQSHAYFAYLKNITQKMNIFISCITNTFQLQLLKHNAYIFELILWKISREEEEMRNPWWSSKYNHASKIYQ